MNCDEELLVEWLIKHSDMHDAPSMTQDTDLFTTGILDSLTLVGLIAHVEFLRGAEIAPAMLTATNFRTIRQIIFLFFNIAGRS